MFSIYDGRDRFYQWDTGRKLIVDDETITQVHFANCLCPDATVCEVSNGLVNVPDELLTQYMDIRVWGYDGEMTKYEQVIEVEKRTKPSDYIYTPEEVKTWEALAAQIEELRQLIASGGNTEGLDARVSQAEQDIDNLQDRVSTCEEYLGIGVGPGDEEGGGPGYDESGEFYIDGNGYWIDYPQSFLDMEGMGQPMDLFYTSCPACGAPYSRIVINHTDSKVEWCGWCGCEGNGVIGYLAYSDGSKVSPYETISPWTELMVVYYE